MSKQLCIRLKFVNGYNETYWYVSSGYVHPQKPKLYSIRETTQDKERAKCFESAEAATAQLVAHGEPTGWSVDIQEEEA